MKVYIAGKISGDRFYKRKFRKAEKLLRKLGCSVMNPAWIVAGKDFSYDDYLKVSGAMQDVCDAVFFLKDWNKSNGATGEMKRCNELGQYSFFEGSSFSIERIKFLQSQGCSIRRKVGLKS